MRGRLLSLAILLVAVGSCKKPPTEPLTVRVTRVTLSMGGEGDAEGPHEREAEAPFLAAAERGLTRAGVPLALHQEKLSPPAPGDFQLRLQVQVQQLAAAKEPAQEPAKEPVKQSAKEPAKLDAKRPPDELLVRVLCAGLLSARKGSLLTQGAGPGEGAEKPEEQQPELTKLEHVGLTEKTFPAAGPPPSPDEVKALVERLIEDSAHTLGAELRLLGNDSRALIALVGKKDGELAILKTAVQILGQRKERLAVPVLVAVVKDGSSAPGDSDAAQREAFVAKRMLRDAAIGALVEIGDQSAVRPLLDSVAFRDHAEMGKIVEAVASLGGDEARRYLQFVQKSHPEPAIRTEAEEALHRLEQRAAPPDAH